MRSGYLFLPSCSFARHAPPLAIDSSRLSLIPFCPPFLFRLGQSSFFLLSLSLPVLFSWSILHFLKLMCGVAWGFPFTAASPGYWVPPANAFPPGMPQRGGFGPVRLPFIPALFRPSLGLCICVSTGLGLSLRGLFSFLVDSSATPLRPWDGRLHCRHSRLRLPFAPPGVASSTVV